VKTRLQKHSLVIGIVLLTITVLVVMENWVEICKLFSNSYY
jgi:uncharacterized membrane protein (DUF441 family)